MVCMLLFHQIKLMIFISCIKHSCDVIVEGRVIVISLKYVLIAFKDLLLVAFTSWSVSNSVQQMLYCYGTMAVPKIEGNSVLF